MKKRTTILEIARQLNVSISTVSRALHDHHSIGLGTKMRVHKLAGQLNYERNETAIFFKQQKKFTIGVILPELSEFFFSTAINGIEDIADKNGYTVLVAQSHDREDREKEIVEMMKRRRIDGLIASLSKTTVSYGHFELLKTWGIPVVYFDRVPDLDGIHYVACDIGAGTVQAVNFLLRKAHRVIGMINGPEELHASKERVGGYRMALEKNGYSFDPELIVSTDLTSGGIYSAMRQLLSREIKPTAVLVFNDYAALDAMQYARKNKLKVNKDICFVSYANLPINNYLAYPPLASVEQYPYQQGRKAAEILLGILSKDEREMNTTPNYRIVLASKLIVHADKRGGLSPNF